MLDTRALIDILGAWIRRQAQKQVNDKPKTEKNAHDGKNHLVAGILYDAAGC